MKPLHLLMATALAATPCAANAQMIWATGKFKAPAGKHWTIAADAEYRTHRHLKSTERWAFGASAEYRYRQFKADAGYMFIDQHKLASEAGNGDITSSYWRKRHRAYLSVTATVTAGQFSLSVRERYQFTHRVGQSVDRFGADGVTPVAPRWIGSQDKHVLRSRLKGEYTISGGCRFSPYVAVEFNDNLTGAFDLEKIRFTAGTTYEIDRHNELEVFYRYNHTDDPSSDERGHVIGIGYTFGL